MKDPKPITALLLRYKSILRAPEGIVLEALLRVLKHMSITLTRSDVRYVPHTKTVHLQCAGPKRSEILLSKEMILASLRQELGEKDAPRDIV